MMWKVLQATQVPPGKCATMGIFSGGHCWEDFHVNSTTTTRTLSNGGEKLFTFLAKFNAMHQWEVVENNHFRLYTVQDLNCPLILIEDALGKYCS